MCCFFLAIPSTLSSPMSSPPASYCIYLPSYTAGATGYNYPSNGASPLPANIQQLLTDILHSLYAGNYQQAPMSPPIPAPVVPTNEEPPQPTPTQPTSTQPISTQPTPIQQQQPAYTEMFPVQNVSQDDLFLLDPESYFCNMNQYDPVELFN